MAKTKVVAVCGPTATGKTALALALCRAFGGELISADSMQVYCGLPVGTAAVQPEEAGGVPVHLSGFLPPEEPFSVADFVRRADDVVAGMAARGRLPVLCGGTGLYLQTLVQGVQLVPQAPPQELRQRLADAWETKGAEALHRQLAQVDPAAAKVIHTNDRRRILRALELWEQTGHTRAQRQEDSHSLPPRYDALCIGLDFADRQQLYARCDARVEVMMRQGLLQEAELVYNNWQRYATAAQAIGYKEFFAYFTKEAELDTCIQHLQQATRNYAKRQLTWFRRMPGVHWLAADAPDLHEKAVQLVTHFLQQPNNAAPVQNASEGEPI